MHQSRNLQCVQCNVSRSLRRPQPSQVCRRRNTCDCLVHCIYRTPPFVSRLCYRNGSHVKIFPPLLPETIQETFTHLLDLRASDNLINGLRAYGANGVWTVPDFSKANHSNSKTKATKKRKPAADSKQEQPKPKAAKPKQVTTATNQVKLKANAAKQVASAVAKIADTDKIDLCNDDDDDSDDDIRHNPDDMDENFQAAIAGSIGQQQGKRAPVDQAEIEAQEARLAIIQTNKTKWQTRIDVIIAEYHQTLTALGEHGLLDFDRHQLRKGEKKLSQQQYDEFWALPGIAESLGHLAYQGAEKLCGTFDSGKWNHPGLLKNTCPYDSAVEEAHRMLCADANMLLLLQQQANNQQATDAQRDAANIILTMHRFASARMWDAARLVVVRHALFVTNAYDHVPPSPFLSENVLDLTSACNYVDRLFLLSGASIGGFALVFKKSCDHEGCGLNMQPLSEPIHGNSNIEFPRQNGFPTFQERLDHWFSLPKKKCKQVNGFVLIIFLNSI